MWNRCPAWLLISTLFLLPACTLWPEHAVKNWQNATGGEALERNFWNDVKAKNWTELERHLGGNYTYVSPQGRWDRAASLDRLRQLQIEEYSLGELQSELNTQTVVVTYTITLRGTRAGQPLPGIPIRMMGVWQQQKAGWMLIAHSFIAPQ